MVGFVLYIQQQIWKHLGGKIQIVGTQHIPEALILFFTSILFQKESLQFLVSYLLVKWSEDFGLTNLAFHFLALLNTEIEELKWYIYQGISSFIYNIHFQRRKTENHNPSQWSQSKEAPKFCSWNTSFLLHHPLQSLHHWKASSKSLTNRMIYIFIYILFSFWVGIESDWQYRQKYKRN